MDVVHEPHIEILKRSLQPITAEDSMAEAGRKLLLAEFIKLLDYAKRSRTDQDIEDVHNLRVTVRRMRSALNLLADFYKPSAVRPHANHLRRLGRATNDLRDLDVLLANLSAFEVTPEQRPALLEVFELLREWRTVARSRLLRTLDKPRHARFIAEFSGFLTTPGAGARPVDNSRVVPYQVRHVLPAMIYDRLAAVLAYDNVVEQADAATLHALRIEFKRLRYAVSLFESVLGSKIKDFIAELKTMQDHLGKLNDIAVARNQLSQFQHDLTEPQAEVLRLHLAQLEAEEVATRKVLPDAWKHFSSKPTQRKLSSAVVALD